METPVGIVSVALGILLVCTRAPLILAPAAVLRGFRRKINSDGRVRALGSVTIAIGAVTAWAGSTADTALGSVLTAVGWLIVAGSTLVLMISPSSYRAWMNELSPRPGEAAHSGWRVLGVAAVGAGAALIWFGVAAL